MQTDIDRLNELEIKFGILLIVTQGVLALLQDHFAGRPVEVEQVEDLSKALESLIAPQTK